LVAEPLHRYRVAAAIPYDYRNATGGAKMPIYMMDCFYRDPGGRLDFVGRERKRIVAHDDRRAITAAESMAILVKPAFFELHTTSPKSRIIYMSPVQGRVA
jgi:hypothetical protein